jgi:photosystem II stability/assembly factor-like uncharacterized protein
MKKIIILISITLLAAGCNLFKQPVQAGVIKTVNGGADWQFSNKYKDSTTVTLSGQSISKLAFSPTSRGTVFAGTYTDGLFESEDSAATWKKILSKIFVYDFVIDPLNPKIIYAAGFYADHGRVLKTTDGGASWIQIYNEESLVNPVRAIAINPLNSNQIVIGLASGSVVKSADSGISWQLAKDYKDQVNRVIWQGNNIYVLIKTKGLYQSTDFGVSFTELTGSLSKTYSISGLSYNEATIDSFSQLYVDPTAPNLIYMTTNRGVQKSVDGGKNWQTISLPIKPANSVARAISVALSSSNIVYASVGNTIYKSLDGGASWQTQSISSNGFVNYLLVDPQLPQIVYGGVYVQ